MFAYLSKSLNSFSLQSVILILSDKIVYTPGGVSISINQSSYHYRLKQVKNCSFYYILNPYICGFHKNACLFNTFLSYLQKAYSSGAL